MTIESITWGSSRDVEALPECPFSHATVCKQANLGRLPHYRFGEGRRGVKFPLEICAAFFKGDPVPAHWLRGELNVAEAS